MKAHAKAAIASGLGKLNPRALAGCFEVYGFDFMVAENLRVYTIEINTNPCLELVNSYLSQIIPVLIESSIKKRLFGNFGTDCDRWERII